MQHKDIRAANHCEVRLQTGTYHITAPASCASPAMPAQHRTAKQELRLILMTRTEGDTVVAVHRVIRHLKPAFDS